MEKITSITRMKETGSLGILAYRYFVDNSTIWFNLIDVCSFFNISSVIFIDKFYDELLDCNKCIFLDNNNITETKEFKRTKFINKTALDQLEANQLMRHAALNIDIQDLEIEEGLTIEDDKNNYEFKQLVQNIKSELNTANKTKLNDYVYELVNTRQINELIEEKEYDPGLEEEVLNYKQWLSEEYDPENNLYMMCKKVYNNDKNQMYYNKYIGPSIDEALDILFNAGKEE